MQATQTLPSDSFWPMSPTFIVVRRQLSATVRSKFDSMDVVQSVWADVLDGLREGGLVFSNTNQLRLPCQDDAQSVHRPPQTPPWSWSGRFACQTVASTRCLRIGAARQRGVLRGRVVGAVARLCPPAHRELLALKRQGATVAEIAVQTHLNEGSVRRILHDLAHRLARLRGDNASDTSSTIPSDELRDSR